MSSASPGAPHARTPAPRHTAADRCPVLCAKCPPTLSGRWWANPSLPWGRQDEPFPAAVHTACCGRPGPPSLHSLEHSTLLLQFVQGEKPMFIHGGESPPCRRIQSRATNEKTSAVPHTAEWAAGDRTALGREEMPHMGPSQPQTRPRGPLGSMGDPQTQPTSQSTAQPSPAPPGPHSARPLRPGQLRGAREAAQGCVRPGW